MKKTTRQAETKEVVTEKTEFHCDLCGDSVGEYGISGGVDWSNQRNKSIDTAIFVETRNQYGADWTSCKRAYHICPGCFPKVEGFLQGRGASPTIEEDGS